MLKMVSGRSSWTEFSFFTMFNTPFGRLPFGIKTAPDAYQCWIHESLQGLSFIEDIADDILCVGEGDTYTKVQLQIITKA